jgi:hypothetical protein
MQRRVHPWQDKICNIFSSKGSGVRVQVSVLGNWNLEPLNPETFGCHVAKAKPYLTLSGSFARSLGFFKKEGWLTPV